MNELSSVDFNDIIETQKFEDQDFESEYINLEPEDFDISEIENFETQNFEDENIEPENLDSSESGLFEISKKNLKWEKILGKWENFVINKCKCDKVQAIEVALKQNLGKMIIKCIKKMSKSEFNTLMEIFKLKGMIIKTKKQFIENIDTLGNIELDILSKIIKIDFVILDGNNDKVINLSNEDQNDKIIILYYEDEYYNAVGMREAGRIQTIFQRNNLPNEIDLFIDKHNMILNQVCEIVKDFSKEEITLNGILRRMDEKITKDKNMVIMIIRNYLENEKFFKT